jgi:hypothetical protein
MSLVFQPTEDESRILRFIVRVAAGLSTLSCWVVIFIVLRNWSSFRRSPHRIVLHWVIADLIHAGAQLPTTDFKDHAIVCSLQGWLIQYSYVTEWHKFGPGALFVPSPLHVDC